MKSITVTVNSATGLHARPASQFISVASQYDSDVSITKGEQTINGKSIMGVLGLGVVTGDAITITATGEDESKAIDAIKALFDAGL